MAEVVHVTDATFEAEVLKNEGPVLVDFWAPWCGPCRMLGPALEELAADYDGKLKVCKVNVDENGQNAQTYGVKSIPAVFLFKGGEKADSFVGARPKSSIAAFVDKHL